MKIIKVLDIINKENQTIGRINLEDYDGLRLFVVSTKEIGIPFKTLQEAISYIKQYKYNVTNKRVKELKENNSDILDIYTEENKQGIFLNIKYEITQEYKKKYDLIQDIRKSQIMIYSSKENEMIDIIDIADKEI